MRICIALRPTLAIPALSLQLPDHRGPYRPGKGHTFPAQLFVDRRGLLPLLTSGCGSQESAVRSPARARDPWATPHACRDARPSA